jgi:hypothetical protein
MDPDLMASIVQAGTSPDKPSDPRAGTTLLTGAMAPAARLSAQILQ